MAFGERLQELRKQQGMSQEGLADKLDTARTTVSRWENGQSLPEIDKLLMISELFKVSLDYLLKNPPVKSRSKKGPFMPTLAWIYTVQNLLGLIASMLGWHLLQAPFFVVTGLLMSILAFVFFEVFGTGETDKETLRDARKRFYIANMLVMLPTPIYIVIEIIGSGEYHDMIFPHFLPGAIYIIAAICLIIYMIRDRKK